MADKPARALVIYGDGIMPAVEARHEHLHRLAASGSCGFLALRTLPSSLSDDEHVVMELSQLLDVYDTYTEKARKEDSAGEVADLAKDSVFKTIAERFMGTKSTFITNSKAALSLSKRAGFSENSLEDFSNASATASKALGVLGFDTDDTNDSPNELVFLHLDAKSASSAASGAEILNSVVQCVQELSKDGSLAYGRLFFVVVLGYGDATPSGEGVPSLRDGMALPSTLAALRPRQSYTMKAGKPVEGIREEYPLLAVYNQVAVTRRDEVQRFLYEDFQKRAGNLVILADRFLYEVAFKLWKAPKYGA